MAGVTPNSIVHEGRMHPWQWFAIAITVGLNALDGFDVLSISFASPGIAKDWGIDQATLGWILSMELLGMAVGSIFLGGMADKIGRRPTILGCLFAMTIGMWFAGHSGNVTELLTWRLLTGLGIGGMLAAINAATAELSSNRWRSLAMALMVIGYPIGGVLGGLGVQSIFGSGGKWHDVFIMGAYATAMFIPLVWFFVPETPAFLDRKQPVGALEKANKTLARFRLSAASALSDNSGQSQKASLAGLFTPTMIAATVLITVAYFAHILSFYFVLKWVPKIVVDLGFEAKAAAGVLTWVNVGGATGGAVFGLLAMRFGLKFLTVGTLLISGIMVMWFGQGTNDLNRLAMIVAITGFFTNSGVVGLYSLFAKIFPTHIRATGTGFAIGVGRGGSSLAPVLGGYLFQSGFALSTVAIVMGSGSLIAALALMLLKVNERD